jgi:hypothetical protein
MFETKRPLACSIYNRGHFAAIESLATCEKDAARREDCSTSPGVVLQVVSGGAPMYVLAMEENRKRSSTTALSDSARSLSAEDEPPGEEWQFGQFDGATGLSPVRELAVALGLVEIDDPALWEPA